ncbi:hypothetical protein A3Q56_06407 [Intoshia linei]|uniref:Uncharacterized protein n=1 Tax=Intoshia linei TaxID=1819745 RepID=A0A177AWY4_9BILA|nr:hypothetical protein A3Q56_06407 [Intoshia linei]
MLEQMSNLEVIDYDNQKEPPVKPHESKHDTILIESSDEEDGQFIKKGKLLKSTTNLVNNDVIKGEGKKISVKNATTKRVSVCDSVTVLSSANDSGMPSKRSKKNNLEEAIKRTNSVSPKKIKTMNHKLNKQYSGNDNCTPNNEPQPHRYSNQNSISIPEHQFNPRPNMYNQSNAPMNMPLPSCKNQMNTAIYNTRPENSQQFQRFILMNNSTMPSMHPQGYMNGSAIQQTRSQRVAYHNQSRPMHAWMSQVTHQYPVYSIPNSGSMQHINTCYKENGMISQTNLNVQQTRDNHVNNVYSQLNNALNGSCATSQQYPSSYRLNNLQDKQKSMDTSCETNNSIPNDLQSNISTNVMKHFHDPTNAQNEKLLINKNLLVSIFSRVRSIELDFIIEKNKRIKSVLGELSLQRQINEQRNRNATNSQVLNDLRKSMDYYENKYLREEVNVSKQIDEIAKQLNSYESCLHFTTDKLKKYHEKSINDKRNKINVSVNTNTRVTNDKEVQTIIIPTTNDNTTDSNTASMNTFWKRLETTDSVKTKTSSPKSNNVDVKPDIKTDICKISINDKIDPSFDHNYHIPV